MNGPCAFASPDGTSAEDMTGERSPWELFEQMTTKAAERVKRARMATRQEIAP